MRRRVTAFAVAVAIVLAATPSWADEGRAPQGALDAYATGRESYQQGLYGRALEAFERSLAIAPSPNTRLYVARSLRELGRWSEAAAQYRITIHEAEARGGRYVGAGEAADLELRDVTVRLERAEPLASPEGTEVPRQTAPEMRAVAAEPRAALAPPAPSPENPRRPSPLTLVSGGLAAAGLASSGVFYALASERFGYLEDHCARVRDGACDDARSTGQRQEAIAYVSLGAAVVFATVATLAWVLEPSPARATAAPATVRTQVTHVRQVRHATEAPWRVTF